MTSEKKKNAVCGYCGNIVPVDFSNGALTEIKGIVQKNRCTITDTD